MMLKKILNVAPVLHNLQIVRTTVVVRRMFPPKQRNPEMTGPFLPKLKRKHFVYIFEDDTNRKPAEDIDVVLTVDVDGIGFGGDVVKVKRKIARTHMLPTGVALYATPENIDKTAHLREMNKNRVGQPESAHRTMAELRGMTVSVPMNPKAEWTLNKTHCKVAFRICGVELNEESIQLPEEPITKPGDYTVQVTVNKMDTIPVKLHVYHISKEKAPVLPPIWSKDPEYTFRIEEVLALAAGNVKRRII